MERAEHGGGAAAPARTFVSSSAQATEALGAQLGGALGPNAVVALVGELATGKTCLVRGLAHGLGAVEPVQSPTFTLLRQHSGRLPLYHFDAWMEGRERAFLEGGGADWLYAGGVAVLEWAGRVADFLPLPRLEITLEHLSLEVRRLVVRRLGDAPGPGQDPAGLLAALLGLRATADLEERP